MRIETRFLSAKEAERHVHKNSKVACSKHTNSEVACSKHTMSENRRFDDALTYQTARRRRHDAVPALFVYWEDTFSHLTSHLSTVERYVVIKLDTAVNIHYENTPFQIYRKFHLQKLKISDKKLRYFSYFYSKHRLWVLVRTALARRF